MSEGYGSWSAIAHAVKASAGKNTNAGTDLNTQLSAIRFDRFLSRVFSDGEKSEWLLKGGTSMLARVPRARATKDVDLAATHRGRDLDAAVEDLARVVSRDLGDHLLFEVVSTRLTGQGDNQPGVETRRVMFGCFDAATRRKVGDVPVDIVVGDAPVGVVEVREPANRLSLPRELQSSPYRLFPIADQIADKVCATMSTKYAGGQSSRVKDLVDLAVIARTQRVDLQQLSVAIATKQARSGLEAFEEFAAPADWDKQYRALAAKTLAVGDLLDMSEAMELVSQLVNPALSVAREPAVWAPGVGWTSSGTDPGGHSPSPGEEGGPGQVHVPAHIRSGGVVRDYWRSRRSTEQ